MAPQVGLEPTTLRLTAGCSAIELLRSESTLACALNCQQNHIRGCSRLETRSPTTDSFPRRAEIIFSNRRPSTTVGRRGYIERPARQAATVLTYSSASRPKQWIGT